MDLVHPGSHSDVLCMYKTSTSTHSHPLNRIKKVVVYCRAQRAKGKSGKKKKKVQIQIHIPNHVRTLPLEWIQWLTTEGLPFKEARTRWRSYLAYPSSRDSFDDNYDGTRPTW